MAKMNILVWLPGFAILCFVSIPNLSLAEYSIINYGNGGRSANSVYDENYYGNYGGVPSDSYSNYDYRYRDDADSSSSSSGRNNDISELEGLLYDMVASTLTNSGGYSSGSQNGAMSNAARIMTHPYDYQTSYASSQGKMGYQQQQPSVMYAPAPAPQQHPQQQVRYSQPQQQTYAPPQMVAKPSGYQQQQPSGYGYSMAQMTGYSQPKKDDDYEPRMRYKPKKKQRQKVKKIYVPIVIRKKKQKKRKIIAVFKGFYIQGGIQIFGKFKKIKDCQKACEITPNCFAADYNPWLKKCYIHTNTTACQEMRTHPKLIHFKKVPCDLLETPRGLITLGVRIHGGLEQRGIKNLQDCIKKCATAGQGIAPDSVPENVAKQICFGIDYDFATHKCYFHTNELLCPPVEIIPTPASVVPAPSVINILLCPLTSVTV